MNLSNDGLSLWYGTPDAPAPGDDGLVPRRGAALVVGVQPPSPSNTLTVRYRVNNGLTQTVPGRELRTDFQRQIQYFAVAFPAFLTGDVVEYLPVLSCAGRQVPAPNIAERFLSKFHLAAKEERAPGSGPARPAGASVVGSAAAPATQRFGVSMDFVASVHVQFGPPQYIGDTATGMRVNFFVRDGTVQGDGFKGKVLEGSSDHLIVRPDGMGVVRIHAAFALDDGATLDVESGGYVDFGPEGYRRALAHDLPDRSPLVVSPLIYTRYPKYEFLSRIQCVGVGQTHLDAGQASYEVYAALPRIPA
jgi:hypothetical protein